MPITTKTFAQTINDLLQNTEKYKQMVYSTLKIRKLNVIDKFYNILKDVPKAQYSDLVFTDTKQQTIRKVNRQRRKSVKMQLKLEKKA